MKRIIICDLPRYKSIEIDTDSYRRTMVVTDIITDEEIRLHLMQNRIFNFISKKTGITALQLRYNLDNNTFYPLLLNRKQINKLIKEYPEFYI